SPGPGRGPPWWVKGSAPCQSRGDSGPLRFSRIGRASAYDSGVVGIFGRLAAFSGGTRCDSGSVGTDANPGVVGSPGYLNMYCTDPRCTPLSGRHEPFA